MEKIKPPLILATQGLLDGKSCLEKFFSHNEWTHRTIVYAINSELLNLLVTTLVLPTVCVADVVNTCCRQYFSIVVFFQNPGIGYVLTTPMCCISVEFCAIMPMTL